MDPREQIRHFLAENFYLGVDMSKLGDEDSLVEKGIIDSTGILDLAAFVEATFGVSVADQDITPENFESIHRLVDYVKRKQQRSDTVLPGCEIKGGE
jgi:acyl carrier protein